MDCGRCWVVETWPKSKFLEAWRFAGKNETEDENFSEPGALATCGLMEVDALKTSELL